MKIEQKYIDEINNLTRKDKFRVLLSGERGTFDFFDNLRVSNKYKNIHKKIPTELAHLKIVGSVYRGTHVDYLDIKAIDNEENPYLEEITNRFATMNETHWDTDGILKVENRAKIVVAYTLSSLLVSVRTIEYIKNDKLILERDSMPIYANTLKFIDGKFKLTRNIPEDIGRLSQLYWYNFPQELTDKENNIKRITLEY